jgi:antitoxin component YwqK of YwqJK toxin-antitoxin module
LLLLCACLLAAPADARLCTLNGEQVNPDNGSTTAGKTGVLTCHRDDGSVWYEKMLQDGEHLGLDRFHDEDGGIREREVNAQGNTEGLAREWYPGGQLKRQGDYRNAAAIGEHRGFHRNGKLQGISVYPVAGKQAAVGIEWDSEGRLRRLACAEQSLAKEDRRLCGHDGKVVTELFDQRGRVQERRTLTAGRTLRSEFLAEGERLAGSIDYSVDGRTEREYFDNGTASSEKVVSGGFVVLRREWYMNGAVKLRLTQEPREREAHSVSERFRDNGTLAEKEFKLDGRTQRRERYDEQGRLAEDWEHAPAGHIARHRKFDGSGALLLDEELYPDGSRKVLKIEAEIGG